MDKRTYKLSEDAARIIKEKFEEKYSIQKNFSGHHPDFPFYKEIATVFGFSGEE